MGKEFNYYLERNSKTGEIVYVEYENGYNISPKARKEDEIEVNKIVFISPSLTEKLIKKKIEHKITSLLNILQTIEEDDSTDDGTVRMSLMDAERLKLNIIKKYAKYLGNTYQGLTLKKIEIIINKLRTRLYKMREIENNKLYFGNNEENKGRRGR